MKKLNKQYLGLLSVGFFLSNFAWGWGLTVDLNDYYTNSHLVFAVIEKKEIRFCMDVQSPRFNKDSVRLQVRSALKLWLDEIEKLGVDPVVVNEVECQDERLNLKVVIGPELTYPSLKSYQIATKYGSNYYSEVKINTDIVTKKNGVSYQEVDFIEFAGGDLASLEKVIQSISFKKKEDVRQFAKRKGFDVEAVFRSSYLTFIHEFGHSFGLCDTLGDLSSCDPKFSSKKHPDSVMKWASYFYLTKDDKAGIKALFQRYLK